MPGWPRTGPPEAVTGVETADDASLVVRAQEGDPQAFALLYGRHAAAIYGYCHGRLGNRETAEDATSLVFTKALTSLPSCRDGSFRAWLFGIAHHVVADRYRARRPEEPLVAAADLADPAPSPEDLLLAAEERRSLHALLARLTPDQRRVVELRLVGLTGPEIAQVLGRSRTSVNVAQFRAVARLRALLGPAVAPKEGSRGDR